MPAPAKIIKNDSDFRGAIQHLQGLVSDDLTAVNGAIMDSMRSPVALIPEMASHLINAGGKRLRPMLTLAAAGSFSYTGKAHIDLAAAVELIHGATLLHDDVVDESILRRGAKTANIIWGNKESVLVGDFLFSRAFELMVRTGSITVLDILSRASAVIAEGEVLQLATQNNVSASYDMYLDVVKAKTAALFAAAAEAGAVVANASQDQQKAFYDYGLSLGIAYQLIDDVLDYSGAQGVLGKSVGDDFREGKMTLPIVFAIAAAKTGEEKSFWQRTIGNSEQKEDDLAQAIAYMKACNSLERTIEAARGFADSAIKALDKIPSGKLPQTLADIADYSVMRSA